MQKLFIVVYLLSIVNIVYAQKNKEVKIVADNAPFEWGKISEADLKMTVYTPDSSADAVVLNDAGEIGIDFFNTSIKSTYKQHRRVKILKKSSFDDQGLVKIPYLKSSEVFSRLKAQVIQPDGSVLVLKSSDILDEKVTEYRSQKKILFPALQEGSIIEYECEINNDHPTSLHDWYFQDDIPVRRSDLTLSIPKVFSIIRGKRGDFFVNQGKNTLTYTTIGNSIEGRKIDVENQFFYADTVASIKSDKYITTLRDYLTHFYFQLKSINYLDGTSENRSSTWEIFTKEMLEGSPGVWSRRKNSYSDAWNDIQVKVATLTTPLEKISALHNFVKNNIEWTGNKGIIPEESLNKVYKEKKGDCADINYLLVALLNEAGIKAFPYLISSRSHGKAFVFYPFREQFNYTLCYIELEGKPFLLDATDPLLSVNMPRIDALNETGFVLDKNNPHWVDIVPQQGLTIRILNIELDKSNRMSGTLQSRFKGYDALIERYNSNNKEALEKSVKNYFSEAGAEVLIDSVTQTNLKSVNEPMNTTVYFKINDAATSAGDIVYLNPTAYFDYTKNPFKQKERKYPIDLPYPERKQFAVNLKIPEGFEVTDLPKSVKVTLLDDAANFQYAVSTINGQVQYTVKLNINRLHFSSEEYIPLKDFFDQVAAKLNEQVVLKKK